MQPEHPGRRPNMMERLYALWIVTTLALALGLVILVVYGSGLLQRQADSLQEMSRRLHTLEKELAARPLSPLPERAAPPTRPPRPEPGATQPATTAPQPPAAGEVAAAADDAGRAPPASGDGGEGAVAPLTASAVEARLSELLQPGAVAPYMLVDEQAAREFLERAQAAADSATLSGAAWVRLAALAELLDESGIARRFSERAEELGAPPLAYWHVAARRRLTRSDGVGARAFALRLLDTTPRSARAQLLAAEALMVAPETAPVEAHEMLDLLDARRLTPAEQILLGRLAVRLERWELLDEVLAARELDDAASGVAARGPLQSESDLLRAIAAIRAGQHVAGLAVLDYLREQGPPTYEVDLWRAIALLDTRSYDAARHALEIVTREASRPEGWYWRGVLALRSGDTQAALPLFQAALTADSRFAPAWEAQAALALEQQDVSKAIEHLDHAIRSGPRRASAYFMLAIAFAKLSNREAAAATLRTALALDATLLDTAKATEVLNRLFSEQDFAELLDTAGSAPASAPATQPQSPE